MPEWFYFVDPQEYGPMSWPQLFQAAAAGQLKPETPVRRSDLGWTTAGQIPELLAVFPAPRPAPARAATPQAVPTPKPAPKTKTASSNPKAWAGAPGASGIQTKTPPAAVRVAAATPIGSAVGSAKIPAGVPVGVVSVGRPNAPAPPRSHSDDAIDAPRKKKPDGLTLIIGLGIASVVLGSVFVAILVFSTSKKKKADPPQNEVAVEEPPATPTENPQPASNPVAEVQPNPVPPVVAPPVAPPSTPKGLPAAFTMNKKYYDLAATRRVKSATSKIEVINIFLAADETGKRVSAESTAEESSAGKFIFVQIEISNSGDKPLTYRSWNHASDVGAMLADDHDTLLSLVPPGQTPEVSRLSAVAEIPPKKMIRDTLVFAAPEQGFDKLRLILPRPAVGVLGPGFVGFETGRDLLTAVVADTPAQTPPKPTDAPAGEPEPVDEPPPVVATPVKPKSNPDGLPTKEEFLKSINGDDDKKDDKKTKEMSPAEREEKMKAEMKDK